MNEKVRKIVGVRSRMRRGVWSEVRLGGVDGVDRGSFAHPSPLVDRFSMKPARHSNVTAVEHINFPRQLIVPR